MYVAYVYTPSDPTHVPFDISEVSLGSQFSSRLWDLAGSLNHCLQWSVPVR